MPKKPKTRKAVYRDKKTGRFASKASYERSRARGGKRFVRERQVQPTRNKRKSARPAKRIRKSHKKTEYQINVKYKPEGGPKVEVQISVIGPPGQSRQRIESVVEHRLTQGNDVIGFHTRIVHWLKYGRKYFASDEAAWNQLKFFFYGREGAGNEEEEE